MIIDLIGMIIVGVVLLLSISYLNGVKVNLLNTKTWLILVFYFLIMLLDLKLTSNITPFYNYLAYFLISYLLLDSNFKRSFLTTNIIYFLIMIIDVILFLLVSYFMSFYSNAKLSLEICIGLINRILYFGNHIYNFFCNRIFQFSGPILGNFCMIRIHHAFRYRLGVNITSILPNI